MTSDAMADARVVGSLRSTDGAGVVHLVARFGAPVEDVWSALTGPGRLAQWLGELDGDLRPGGEFHARFTATGWEGTGRVQACEPPARVQILTRSTDEPDCIIECRLSADGEQTVVVIEDRGLPLDQIAAYGAGDQVLVEGLVSYLAGNDRPDPQARWKELHPAYQELAAGLR